MFGERFERFKLRAIDRSSLQFRLTLEIAMLSVLSLSSVAAWTSWKMQDILITAHTQNVKYIATRFPRDVELYSDMLPPNVGLQKTIDNVLVPNLVIWVKSADSKQLLAQSNGANASFMADDELIDHGLSISRSISSPASRRRVGEGKSLGQNVHGKECHG